MTANNKRGISLSIVGFTFAASGFLFSVTGNSAMGISILGTGLFLITAGMAAARKSPPPEESPGIQPPAKGDTT
jgi:hypothetical protein